MNGRRYLACEFNLRELRKRSKNLYMWTMTFPYFANPREVRYQVRQMIQYFNRRGASGVRCYEQHKSGSLHIHAVIDQYFHINPTRSYWKSIGGGRIHVKFLQPNDNGMYIAKEVMKSAQKRGFPPKTRVYASFGKVWKAAGKSLVADIVFECDDFSFFLQKRGERFDRVGMFRFGLEYLGVGYADNPRDKDPSLAVVQSEVDLWQSNSGFSA